MFEILGVMAIAAGSIAVQGLIYRDSVRRGVSNSRGARLGLHIGAAATVVGTLCGLAGATVGMLA